MALTGFDPAVVYAAISKVQQSYNELTEAIDRHTKTFVEGMSTRWACNYAQSFFNDSFAPIVKELYRTNTAIYESVVNSMNSAGQAWANNTNSAYNQSSFSAMPDTVDVSMIQENINGVRGIDLQEASNVAGKLSLLAEDAMKALGGARSAVNESGFFEGNMQSELCGSLDRIQKNISDALNRIINDTKTAIDKTVETYKTTEGEVSRAFAGQE